QMSLILLEQARKDGNTAFGEGDYEKAASFYEAALKEEEDSRRVEKGEKGEKEIPTEGVLIEEIEDDDSSPSDLPDQLHQSEAAATAAADAAAAANEETEQQLQSAPLEVLQMRAVLLSNLAAARIKQENWASAVAAATLAIDSGAVQNEKAIERRAHAYSNMENKEDDALSDYKTLLEKCPDRRDVVDKIRELEVQIAARNERIKDEMIDKMKQFGNFFLKPFGLSTDSFQMVPNGEGGYSVKMSNGDS
ncbi:hypothetical protein PENTCL1PPCAC_24541, partial [Pristionchus entomophagus]